MKLSNLKKQDCCGCSVCVDSCPKHCITMVEDKEGFLYPQINTNECLNCGKCKTVCPIIQAERLKINNQDDIAYAFVTRDSESLQASSSGGAFSAIMDAFIGKYKDNYCIVGAAFDGTKVVHKCVENREAANAFRKSKYVQSKAVGIYQKVKECLLRGEAVLFSGTPCMVAGLKAFLGKDYEKLLTVDIICHGVPNQAIFSSYLDDLSREYGERVQRVDFRIKKGLTNGTINPRTINVTFESGEIINLDISECEYLYGFHTGLYFRPACANCPFASSNRPADITLGDYWGIEKLYPMYQSNKGVSLIRFNTKKGGFILSDLMKGRLLSTSYAFACHENEQLLRPSKVHRNREKFFRLMRKGVSVSKAVDICKKPDNLIQKIYHKLISIKKV